MPLHGGMDLSWLARRPKEKYCQTIQAVPNSAVTGHTMFMIHMCWG